MDALVPYRQNKHVLFGQQEGRFTGCRSEFPFRVLEVDHIIPGSGGGQGNIKSRVPGSGVRVRRLAKR